MTTLIKQMIVVCWTKLVNLEWQRHASNLWHTLKPPACTFALCCHGNSSRGIVNEHLCFFFQGSEWRSTHRLLPSTIDCGAGSDLWQRTCKKWFVAPIVCVLCPYLNSASAVAQMRHLTRFFCWLSLLLLEWMHCAWDRYPQLRLLYQCSLCFPLRKHNWGFTEFLSILVENIRPQNANLICVFELWKSFQLWVSGPDKHSNDDEHGLSHTAQSCVKMWGLVLCDCGSFWEPCYATSKIQLKV